MTISDAQFAHWMQRRDVTRVLLAEQAYGSESGGAPASPEALYYFSTLPYATQSHESPASQIYSAAIQAAGMSLQIDVSGLGGRTKVTIPEMVLGNSDGLLDQVLNAVIDGYECTFYLGDPSWARSDFRAVGVAVAENAVGSDRVVRIKYRDKRLLLDQEIQGDALGGSGPNATRYLPLLWGSVENIDLVPYIDDDTTFEYGVISNYSASSLGVSDVREGGVSLRSDAVVWTSGDTTCDAGTDVVTHVAHGLIVDDVVYFKQSTEVTQAFASLQIAKIFGYSGADAVQLWVKSAPTADTVTFSRTKGGATLDFTDTTFNSGVGDPSLNMIRSRFYDNLRTDGHILLSAKAEGRVTADVVSNNNVSGSDGDWPLFMGATSPIAKGMGLAYAYGNLTLAEIDSDAASAADTALDAKVATGYTTIWIPARQNLVRVLDDWFRLFFAWYGDNGLGVITCGLLDISGIAAASADHTLSALEIENGIQVENVPVSLGGVNLQYTLNQTVQSDLLAAVSDEDRAKYGAPFADVQPSTAPSGTTYLLNKPLYHKTMTDAPPIAANIQTTIPGTAATYDLGNYADEIVADHAPHIRLVNLRVGLDKYDWALGEVVEITYPRFGFDDGRNARIVGRDIDWIGETVDLALIYQFIPGSA